MMKKVLMALVILFVTVSNTYVYADVTKDVQHQYEQAKTNLVLGNLDKAEEEFKALEKLSAQQAANSECYQDLHSNVLYNLGLVYEMKYALESPDKDLLGASTDDIVTANAYFDKADPEIIDSVVAMATPEDGLSAKSNVRAVGGIVGRVIKGKVKGWLKSPQNCSCSFTNSELDLASKTFISLTEKADIPQLKNMKTRMKKIQEIFSRINNYVASKGKSSPLGVLFFSKIKVKCKL